MDIALNRKGPPDWSKSPTQVKQCVHDCRGITALPRELVETILANLDGRDLVVCKRVTRAWKDIVDTTPMLSRAFYRCMHPQAPVPALPETVKNNYLSLRNWLKCFSEQGRELVIAFDQAAERNAPLFPERLFFSLARLLAETPVLHCRTVCTIEHAGWINQANFSPDGRYVITASGDKTAKIYQRGIDGQWREITTLAHPDIVMHAYFSPTGDYCLIVCWNHTIHLWERGETDKQWQRHMTPLHCAFLHTPSFSANGDYLVILPTWHTTQIYQLIDGQWQRQTTLLDGDSVREALFHPRDNILATVHQYFNVYIWRLVDGEWKYDAGLQHPYFVPHIGFSPDGNRLLVTSQPETQTADQYTTYAYIYSRAGEAWHKEAVISLAETVYITRFSPNGDKLVTVSHIGNIVTIWQFVDNQWQEVILPQAETFTNARFSPAGDRLVTTTKHNTTILWRQGKQQWQQEATLHFGVHCPNNRGGDAQFSPHGHQLATIPDNGDTKIWGVVNGTWQEKSYPSLGRACRGTFSPDGLYFLTCSMKNHTANIWTFQQGQP